jgi:hypothetical protein
VGLVFLMALVRQRVLDIVQQALEAAQRTQRKDFLLVLERTD